MSGPGCSSLAPAVRGKNIFSRYYSLFLPLFAFGLWLTIGMVPERFFLFPSWPDQIRVVVWPNRIFSLLVVILCFVLPVLAIFLRWSGQRLYSLTNATACRQRWEQKGAALLYPLSFLPLGVLPFFFLAELPDGFPAGFQWYFSLVVFSFVLLNAMYIWGTPVVPGTFSSVFYLLFFICWFLVYWVLGLYFVHYAGDANGDAGHYKIQAESLYFDHDLDLSNNFDPKELRMVERYGPDIMHISHSSRPGHQYSWHSFGLSVLLAPFIPFGDIGINALLACIGAFGSLGMLLSSSLCGARKESALLVSLLFSCSTYWAVYAFQILPETIGATLLLWMLVGILFVSRRPFLSCAIVIFCCILLPWMHTRFVPPAALFAVFYLWRLGTSAHSVQRRVLLSGLFLGISLLGAFVYFRVNAYMFTTASSYPLKNVLFTYPLGMWKIFVSDRGVAAVLPMFPLLLAATLGIAINWPGCAGTTVLPEHSGARNTDSEQWTTFTNSLGKKWKENRDIARLVLAAVFIIVATSCSFPGWDGGAALIGRYLLVGTPLLLPFAALLYDRCDPVTRWFFIFMGLIPCALLGVLFGHLYEIKGHFTDPLGAVAFFSHLLEGLPNFFDSPHDLYGVGVYLVAFLLIFTCRAGMWWHLFFVGTFFLVSGRLYTPHYDVVRSPFRRMVLNASMRRRNSSLVSHIDTVHSRVSTSAACEEKRPLVDVFQNRFQEYNAVRLQTVTQSEQELSGPGTPVSPPRFELNDRQGHSQRWTALVPSFSAARGEYLFCFHGRVEGNVLPVLAVAELSGGARRIFFEYSFADLWVDGVSRGERRAYNHDGKLFRQLTRVKTEDGGGDLGACFSLDVQEQGQIYILARLEGQEGLLTADSLYWFPVGNVFVDKTCLSLPYPLLITHTGK